MLVLEAENGLVTAGANNHTWLSQTSQSGYAGESYLRALPDIGQLYEIDELDDSPQLTYPIYTPPSADYTVWVRATAAGAAGDSLHLGLNGQAVANTTRLTGFSNQDWQWQSLTMSNTQPVLSLAGGADSLNLWMREDGLRIDRLLLVTDTNYIPTGSGPAVSAFQLITHSVPAQQNSHIIHYTYDDLYRLTEATYSGDINSEYNYAYDPVGNMTAYTETVGAETSRVTRTFDDANRLQTSFDLEIGTTNYLYDNNGNLSLVIPPGGESWLHYEYDQRNLMISHTISISGTSPQLQATYSYDGSSNRVQQVDDTGTTPITTTYTNDIMGLSQVLVADDGSSQTHLLFGLDLISQDDGNATRYLLADGLGSVRVEMVDDAVATVITYEPFGKVLQQAGSSDTVYGFTGEQYDTSTNQLYLRARYYDPALHTFMSQDPWSGNGGRPQSMNGWSYVNNSPVNLADPTGMKPFPDDCRSAGPTAVEYGNCVRKYYGVEPPNEQGFTDIVLHFQMVQGVQGCWEGPVPYRAGGYFEGVTFTLAAVVAAFGGGEVVYDFAAMQRQSYVYDGSGIVNMLGFSLSAYFGSLEGMRSYRSIELDYSGDFEGYFLGGGPRFPNLPKPPIGPILTTGKLNFAGVPDNSVSGEAWYVTTGIGAGIPYIDPGKILKTSYVPATSITRYAPSGPGPRTVTREYLIEDIINGTGSPISHERNRTTSHFPMASDYIKTGLWTFLQLKRSSGISDAVNYADIFDGIHNDSFLTSSPYSR